MNVHLRKVPSELHFTGPLAPSLEQQRLRLMLALLALDVVAIFASFLATGLIYLGDTEIARQEAFLIAPLFVLLGLHGGLYRSDLLNSIRGAAYKCLYIIAISATILIMASFYAKTTENFSRVILTFGCTGSLLLCIGIRAAIAAWLHRTLGPSLRNTLIIDAGGPAVNLDHAYRVCIKEHDISANANDPVNLDRIGRYMENMDRVIISCPIEDRDEWVPLLRAAGVDGEFVSSDLWQLGALKIHNERGFTGIVVSARPLGIGARVTKRAVDLILATVALVMLAPIMVLVILAIKLEDGGPIFFRQRRIGSGNRFIWVYKFRSMRVETSDADANKLATRDDNRITRVGKFIRRTSIDELPQLINVWSGNMSLVGPRPHALGALAGEKLYWEIDGRYWNRHALKPGLTGLAQVRGFRGNTENEQSLSNRLQADLEYISNWSLWLDAKIIFATFKVLLHDNAY